MGHFSTLLKWPFHCIPVTENASVLDAIILQSFKEHYVLFGLELSNCS